MPEYVSDDFGTSVYKGFMLPLREIRKARGFTAKQVADGVGTTEQSISRIEREEQPLTLDMMRKLKEFLGVSIGQIIGEEPASHTPPLPARPTEPAVTTALVGKVVEALEMYLVEEKRDLAPHDKAQAIITLLEWAIDNPDLVTSGIDVARFRAFIRHLIKSA